MRPAAGALLTLLLLPSVAAAHANTEAYGSLRLSPSAASLELFVAFPDWHQVVNLDADRDNLLTREEVAARAEPIEQQLRAAIRAWSGDEPCPFRVSPPELMAREGKAFVRSRLDFDCPGALRFFSLRYDLFARVHPGHKLLARVENGDSVETRLWQTDPRRGAVVEIQVLGPPPGLLETARDFGVLGLEHIFTGFDHILFLLALIVLGASLRRLVAIVTAFTLAHSVTLALTVLDRIEVPGSIVEPLIAASIVAVAAENIVLGERLARLRVPITFVFGLVHGMGFGQSLEALQIPDAALIPALVSFNLGVELGQISIVALLYPALRWLRRQPFERQAVRGISAAILLAGAYWLIERTLL